MTQDNLEIAAKYSGYCQADPEQAATISSYHYLCKKELLTDAQLLCDSSLEDEQDQEEEHEHDSHNVAEHVCAPECASHHGGPVGLCST